MYFYDPKEEYKNINGVRVRRAYSKVPDYPYLRFSSVEKLFEEMEKRKKPYEPIVIVIEELLTVPKKDFKHVAYMAVMHRFLNCTLYGATQRPVCIPREMLAICNEVHCGLIDDNDDLKKIKHLFSPEEMKKIPALKAKRDRIWIIRKGG